MPVDVNALIDDLDAETAWLLAMVEPLDAAGWATPTPAPGWRVQEQVAHLAYFDEAATTAATDADAFQRELEAALADPDGITERISRRARDLTPAEVFTWLTTARAAMRSTFLALDPSTRVPWYGPAMSIPSSLTARIMETWAHGQDIADALGAAHDATGALRQVAHIGVRTFANSFAARGRAVPEVSVFVALAGPDGTVWQWGEPESDERVEGDAVDFALVVTQRRHVDDTALQISGPVAAEWMSIAQAFAGPPGAGREPRAR
ncbi:MAG: TIGR03084 family metal-binding protein [Acidimicrobiia bacterium]